MKKQGIHLTLEQLFEFTKDAFTEPYEVVRTIGFKLKSKGGTRELRLEAIKNLEKELSSVLVFEKRDDVWKEIPMREPTLDRLDSDVALRLMPIFPQQPKRQTIP
jgi:hypothetical protein